jgi:hypothetical protein
MAKYLAFAALLLVSPVAGAQNYLTNSGFDIDLAGWQLSGAVVPEWADFDVLADPNSGSALIKNVEAGAASDVEVLHQCVAEGPGQYVWGAWFYIPSGQAATGSAVVRYRYYANTADCSGGINGAGGHQTSGPFDQWLHLQGNPINAAAGGLAGSVEFIVAIRKTEAAGEFRAYVDDALLFKELLFKNSFE